MGSGSLERNINGEVIDMWSWSGGRGNYRGLWVARFMLGLGVGGIMKRFACYYFTISIAFRTFSMM
jgi:hypothetical protein